jgi:predicted transcriptional regulator
MNENEVGSAVAKEIMTPYVIMLNIHAQFKDVIHTLDDKKITAIFIHDRKKDEYYIISQKDIIQFLNSGGLNREDLANTRVTEIMKGPIETVDSETSVDKIIRFMTENNYKRVLISKEGKACGVISTRDIMKWNDTYLFKLAKPQIRLFIIFNARKLTPLGVR